MKDLTIALDNRPGALAEMGDALWATRSVAVTLARPFKAGIDVPRSPMRRVGDGMKDD